ncbi:phosphotransferase family protein [Actinorugispora endophytica]|uniref:Aminoglycoside phosphotransferase (APT) family kinase protein n=1 Tax=Actinorugispora endophytica TaxID=1605990 RepID=A0A4R6V759_9ACTN|nr:aminoglycoside phosphotransferase family protein [Actinorugispora endophytica]TDQ54357.1 aminoglycoside phosphotransferase (APT) family kinase protein [Actinorugispora endophytica]
MTDEIRVLLALRLPELEVRSVTRAGGGLDNLAYEVNGELIVRVSREADPALRRASVRREADLLAVVAGLSPLPVPEPVLVDPAAGVLAYPRLPGLPLNECPVADPARLAAPLGEFVGRLHGTPREETAALAPPDDTPLAVWLREAEEDYREVRDLVPAHRLRLVEDFLDRTPPPEPRDAVFCHNDLGAEHILADAATSTVTGVLDWTDAALADPAHDLARLYRDLPPEVFDLLMEHYPGRCDDAARERIAFYARCCLLEDLAYGVRSGRRHYTRAALDHLDHVFARTR